MGYIQQLNHVHQDSLNFIKIKVDIYGPISYPPSLPSGFVDENTKKVTSKIFRKDGQYYHQYEGKEPYLIDNFDTAVLAYLAEWITIMMEQKLIKLNGLNDS